MSESGESSPIPAPVPEFEFSDADISRFLTEKWKIQYCEICGVAEWHFDSVHRWSVIPASPGGTFNVLSSVVTIFLRVYCGSCGNTKFLNAHYVKMWLDANR